MISMMPGIRCLPVILLTIVWSSVLCACPGKSRLPADPGLLTDDLGTGIHLGMLASDAESASVEHKAELEYWVLSRDELSTRQPYSERPVDKDLVLAIHSEQPAANGHPAGDMVTELRCYLATASASRITLLGNQAAALTPDSAVALLGEPVMRNSGSDGMTHLTWYFSPPPGGSIGVKVVTSYEVDEHCFALAVSLCEELPQ